MVRRPTAFVSAFVVLGWLAAGCSSSSDNAAPTADAAADDSSASGDSDLPEASSPEASAEAGPDAASFRCPAGSWGSIPNTECDLVAQNCGGGLTCYPNVIHGQGSTSCALIGRGVKGRGQGCSDDYECKEGLTCVAHTCTPFCCSDYQYEICGPGGTCSLQLQLGSGQGARVCSFATPCTMWADDCGPDFSCQPIGEDGSAICNPPASGAFVEPGAVCDANNDCNDAQGCFTSGGTGISTCRYYCKRGESPFQAGDPNGPPGQGGCPPGQACREYQNAPSWMGVCTPTK